jgi:hypothetical protein
LLDTVSEPMQVGGESVVPMIPELAERWGKLALQEQNQLCPRHIVPCAPVQRARKKQRMLDTLKGVHRFSFGLLKVSPSQIEQGCEGK